MNHARVIRLFGWMLLALAIGAGGGWGGGGGGGRAAADVFLPGYRARISGHEFKYHSPDPDVTAALLARARKEVQVIEWETESVPEKIEGEFVSFVWMFALRVGPGRYRFDLSVNGERWFEFHTAEDQAIRDWTIDGPRGSSLRFRATMIDRFDDFLGYATLRVPAAALEPGKPLRLTVAGEDVGSNAFYITYQGSVREGAGISSRPAVARDQGAEGGNFQPVLLNITHLGEPVDVVIEPSFGAPQQRTLQLGGNLVELRCPESDQGRDITVRVSAVGKGGGAGAPGDRVLHSLQGRIEPVRHWTIDLVQHTHTDVGYTRPQTEILAEHLRSIDTALDLCDKTDEYPDDAKFRWTCEASWAVREYLENRSPEQIARLRRRVQEGRIEITGMFLNMSELIDEGSYAAFLGPIRTLREHGLPVTTAMQNDVHGVAWCLADQFSKVGIEYLTMGSNAHRALLPFDVPTCFWWESPSGNRVLAYRADHYHTGNQWGVHTGKVEVVEDGLQRYLSGLEQHGYPFDRVAVQNSGYPTDNSPPSTAVCDLVRAWNQNYVWPRLRCSLAREFPEHVKRNHAAELPVHRRAWTDWWTDGFGSAARESAAARETQARLAAAEGLLAMELLQGVNPPATVARDIAEARDDLIFWGEHTLGAAESIREPLCENSVVQWAEKSAYAWAAVKRSALIGEAAMGGMRDVVGGAPEPRVLVVNTLSFPRSGVAEVYAAHEQLPMDRNFRLLDEQGNQLRVQRVTNLPGTRAGGDVWAVEVGEMPAFGWRTFRVEVLPDAPDLPRPRVPAGEVVESEHYRLRLNKQSGAIASLVDRHTGAELVDPGSEWGLGQVVHESLSNREQLEGFRLESFSRRSLEDVVIDGLAEGPIWTSLHLHGRLPGCRGPDGVRCEIRLFHAQKMLELHYTVQKERVFDPEGLYVAFPFAPADGLVAYDTLGAEVRPGSDILPGSASDWQTVQTYAAVRWPDRQVVLSSREIPLMQFGGINLGKFMRETRVDKPHLFSWVMNNYWTTNFCASQEGEFRWSYALTTGPDSSRAGATRFGWATRAPLLGRVIPAGGRGSTAPACQSRSVLPIDAPNLILVAARPSADGSGVVLHLREVEGQPARLQTGQWRAGGRACKTREIDILEQDRGEVSGSVEFAPFETRFLLVRPE